MDSLSTFFAMGGYAGFVWPTYGVSAVVLIGLLAASLRDLKASEADLARLQSGPEGDDEAQA